MTSAGERLAECHLSCLFIVKYDELDPKIDSGALPENDQNRGVDK